MTGIMYGNMREQTTSYTRDCSGRESGFVTDPDNPDRLLVVISRGLLTFRADYVNGKFQLLVCPNTQFIF